MICGGERRLRCREENTMMRIIEPRVGSRLRASVVACAAIVLSHAAAVHGSRAVDVHHAGGQPESGCRPLVPLGYVVPAPNAGARIRLHGGVALVRRLGPRMARLDKLELSRERPARPYPGHLVLGRALLGRPLSQSPVVFESIELGSLGHAGIQAASAASAEATLHTAASTAVERSRPAPDRVLTARLAESCEVWLPG